MHEALDTARSGEGEMYTFLPLQDERIFPHRASGSQNYLSFDSTYQKSVTCILISFEWYNIIPFYCYNYMIPHIYHRNIKQKYLMRVVGKSEIYEVSIISKKTEERGRVWDLQTACIILLIFFIFAVFN